jgi:hypothetical protein
LASSSVFLENKTTIVFVAARATLFRSYGANKQQTKWAAIQSMTIFSRYQEDF